tara:strand:+ start:276 stop:605 length:330 start_codon:yes stop_codon:yes gene_type:complete
MARDSLIRFRRGNQTEWLAINNPNGAVLAAGEPGFDSVNNLLKVGDGTTPWATLHPIGSGVASNTTSAGGGSGIVNMVQLSQAQYDALSLSGETISQIKLVGNTLYFIV